MAKAQATLTPCIGRLIIAGSVNESGTRGGSLRVRDAVTHGVQTMKRTFQPSVVKRKRTHGFLVRMRSRGGASVIRARRAKGRARLAV